MTAWALFLAVFLACVVEAVEAVTIVLAAGTARNWRSALVGVAAGILTLAVVVAALGPAVSVIPLGSLRLFVGGLLLVFGLQWLRKAILRASGYKALHDETEIYARELAAARAPAAGRASAVDRESGPTGGVAGAGAGELVPARGLAERPGAGGGRVGWVTDWYAFTLSFKGVVLEGLEVVFIALTFGSNQHDIPLAAVAAGAAVLLISGLGFAVRAPLARVPENTLKFVVGTMLTGFGMFWGTEGAGAQWPGADASLLAIIPLVGVFALALVGMLRRYRLNGDLRGRAGTAPRINP